MKIRSHVILGLVVVAVAFGGMLGISYFAGSVMSHLKTQQMAAQHILITWERLGHVTANAAVESDRGFALSNWRSAIDSFDTELTTFVMHMHNPRLLRSKSIATDAQFLQDHWIEVKYEIELMRENLHACLLRAPGRPTASISIFEEYALLAQQHKVYPELNLLIRKIQQFDAYTLSFTQRINSMSFELDVQAKKTARQLSGIIAGCILLLILAIIFFLNALRLAETTEGLYRLFTENASDVIWKMTPAGLFTFVSPSATTISGFSREELANMTLEKRLTPASAALAHKILAENLVKREGPHAGDASHVSLEWEEYHKNGRTYWSEVKATIVRTASGEVSEIIGVTRDISERKIAVNALLAEKELLAVTLHSIADAVMVTDVTGCITLINAVAVRILKLDEIKVPGKRALEITHFFDPETNGVLVHPITYVLQSEKAVHQTTHAALRLVDGTVVRVAYSCAPMVDQENRCVGCVLVFRDITQEVRLQDEMQRSARLESLGILAGGIAHDFNNLLSGILNNVSLVRLQVDKTAEVVTALTDLDVAVTRARDLTRQLLTFARGGAPVKKSIDLRTSLRDWVRFMLRGSPHTARFEIDPSIAIIEADEGQISQVINNLVLNAAQAMTLPGTITISACFERVDSLSALPLDEGTYVFVGIRDTGSGIAANVLPRIFDPFFTTKSQGTGLGLASAFFIVKLHRGYLQVVETSSTGTLFGMYLPASTNDVCIPSGKHTLEPMGNLRVLVMDDEEILRRALAKILVTFGYQVDVTAAGEEALVAYETAIKNRHRYDCVILDLTVPGRLGGRETLAHMKVLDGTVYSVVSSGYSNDPVMAQFRDFGFSDCLAKPYRLEELQEVMQRALVHKQTMQPEA